MLKIKNTPAVLTAHRFEEIWPGDDAVDLEASDLAKWAIHGGRAGLILDEKKEPAIITCRPLVEREIAMILPLIQDGNPNTCAEAFRFGVVSITGFGLQRERVGGLNGLTDRCLDLLATDTISMPFLLAFSKAAGAESDEENPQNMDTALPWAIGAHILGASFRKR